jgi:hypothetical protein
LPTPQAVGPCSDKNKVVLPQKLKLPLQQGGSLSYQATVPFSQATVPFSQATVPFSQATVPFSQATVPFSQATVPFSQATIPFSKGGSEGIPGPIINSDEPAKWQHEPQQGR